MRSYTQPNFDDNINELRAQIERDYEQLAQRLHLPKHLDFYHACKAVLSGGLGMNDGSPYETFRNDLMNVVSSAVESADEVQDSFEILSGVWNHFPHNDLDGLSPVEKMRTQTTAPNIFTASQPSIGDEEYLAQIDREVLSFSNAVAKNLLAHLKKIGFGRKEQQHILDNLSDPKQDPNTAVIYLVTQMINTAKKANNRITLDDIQPAARALMWCENYTASAMPNGHWNSRMFQNIIEQAFEYNTSAVTKKMTRKTSQDKNDLILDPSQALLALSLIHEAITEFSDEFDIDIGIEEATRHLVDWLALTDIHELLKLEDLNTATLYFMSASRLIAVTGDPSRPYKRLATRLNKEIKSGAGTTSYDVEVKRIAQKALMASQDPVMLMPYPGKEPTNCLEYLTKLAPDIKSNQSPNGDIPSPFYPYSL